MNQEIWIDCLDKLSDLDYDVDNVSDDTLPTFPLSQDSLVGPIMVKLMNEVIHDMNYFYCRLSI